MSKQIQPVQIWKNGVSKSASVLSAIIINDDLASSATFYYQLKEGDSQDAEGNVISGQSLADGNVSMSGQDYIDWDNSNDSAYAYIASQLNLVII
jgi:hypothetical protein